MKLARNNLFYWRNNKRTAGNKNILISLALDETLKLYDNILCQALACTLTFNLCW